MKLAIVVRKDLGMRCGKIAVQVGHASVMAYRMANGTHEGEEWYDQGQKKIVLKVKDKKELEYFANQAMLTNIQVNWVCDFGLTQIEPNTFTCIAFGPDTDVKIDGLTQGLSLL